MVLYEGLTENDEENCYIYYSRLNYLFKPTLPFLIFVSSPVIPVTNSAV